MAEIKQLKEGDKFVYPLTITSAIVDENGNRVTIPSKTSELSNDSGFVTSEPTEEVVGDIEATLVTTALRKTPQTLTDEEKRVVRNNIGIDVKVVTQSETITTIQPNVLNVWGEVASLDITLAEPTDNTIVNEYMAQFTSGATATTLTLPNTIKWMAAPNIQPNKTYQLSVVNNLAIIGEFGDE